jgi:hypothetical protein
VTTASGLAEAGADAATNATLCVLRAFSRLQIIQFHYQLLESWSAA